ncbi:MAG TPA: nitrilase-related carbon-nitrogen hydrolase [Actinomycetes bacterium]|nr:nitrilase-related carbon-nitrogen hydrolase [Actinomycetes bacterium]
MRIASVQLEAFGIELADQALEASLAAIEAAARRQPDVILLPECTWPGYILGSDWVEALAGLPPDARVLDRFSAAAAGAAATLVVGLALTDGGRARNVAAMWGPDGALLGMVHKRFLWDFDRCWFQPGQRSPVFDTPAGRIGVIVCADGRMPEIARSLAVQGAEVILDPTAWVAAGSDPATWTNPQYEHMLPTRARENGVWVVAANKVGIERDAVAYCGRSCMIDPTGQIVVQAPSDRPALLVRDCDTAPARPPVERLPRLYRALATPTRDLPVARILAEPVDPGASGRRLALDGLDRPLGRRDLRLLSDLSVDLLVTPRPAPHLGQQVATVAMDRPGSAWLSGAEGHSARWSRTHGAAAPGREIGPVVEARAGRVGVMVGEDGLVPEVCRSLMLQGADLVVWFAGDLEVAAVAATRAAENRVHVAVSTPPGSRTSGRVLSPAGTVLVDAGSSPRLLLADVAGCEPRRKEMAPGTDVVWGRQPEAYGPML